MQVHAHSQTHTHTHTQTHHALCSHIFHQVSVLKLLKKREA